MPAYFADTSALVKLYLSESGSSWFRSLDLSALALSALAIPELASALARRRRDQQLSEGDVQLVWRSYRQDLRGWQVIGLAQPLLASAAALLMRPSAAVPLRALDALHLACALEAQRRRRRAGGDAVTFLTADARLEAAAKRANLAVDNPERHDP